MARVLVICYSWKKNHSMITAYCKRILYFDVYMLLNQIIYCKLNWAWNKCKECTRVFWWWFVSICISYLRLGKAACFPDGNYDMIFWTIPMPSASLTGITALAIRIRVTSLEQLSVAEFSGEQTRPKVYENGHKKVWSGIELFYVKNWLNLYVFFH